MLGQKERRDLKPDAQACDKIVIETVPRYKTSGLSGDEWRISASIKFYRKGILVHEDRCGNIDYATRMLSSKYIEFVESGKGYFAGERNICDQEGCETKATTIAKKKFDWCQQGHKSNEPSNAYRMFCDEHKRRGDCGLDDADANYEFTKLDIT